MQFGQLNGSSPLSAEGMDSLAKAITVSQAEWMRLASRRGKAYMALPATVANCRSPQDVVLQQQAFLQQCAQDYVTATQTMMSSWAMFMPFSSAITGLGDTVNDESLNSAPTEERERDMMSVGTSGEASRKSESDASRPAKRSDGRGDKQAAA